MHAPSLILAQAASPTVAGVPLDALGMVLGLVLLGLAVVLDARRRVQRQRAAKP